MTPRNPSNPPEDNFWHLAEDSPLRSSLPDRKKTQDSSEPESKSEPAQLTEPADPNPRPQDPQTPPPPAEPPTTPEFTSETPATSDPNRTTILPLLPLLLTLLVLALGGVTLFYLFSQSRPWSAKITTFQPPQYPVAGEHLALTSLESWWRQPVREGPDLDPGVQPNAALIPTVRLTLSPQSEGLLRCIFLDDQQKRIGDPITLEVRNGRFALNQQDHLEIICTEGLTDPNLIHPYLQGEIKPWRLDLLEAPASNPSDLQPLLSDEISSHLRDS